MLLMPFFFTLLFVLFDFNRTAGAYYPAQPQYSPSVQPAQVMITPTQQQQQAPPPQQPSAQPQGPVKRERKPVCVATKGQRASWLISEQMNGEKCIVCFMWNFPCQLKITIA